MNFKKIVDISSFNKSENVVDEPGAGTKKQKMRKWTKWVIAFLVIVILWKLLVLWGVLPSLTFPAVSSNTWQTVFLTNGQVYFGHLKELNKDYAILQDVYYLRISQQLQPPESEQAQPNVNLVKLGDELHGPEDIMYIPKTQIIFWENMKEDSAVVKAIKSTL